MSVPLELRAAAHRRQDASLDLGLDLHGRSPQVSNVVRVDETSSRSKLRALAREDRNPRRDLGLDLHGMFDSLTGRSGRRRTGAARRGPWT